MTCHNQAVLARSLGLFDSDLKPLRFDHECILHVKLAHMCCNTAFNLVSMVALIPQCKHTIASKPLLYAIPYIYVRFRELKFVFMRLDTDGLN